MGKAPQRPSIPGWLVVVGGLIIAILLFRVVAVVLGTVFFVFKLAIVAFVVVAIGALIARRGSRR